jgi:MTH538 TIR-like domain (DUF1863)
MARQAFFSFHHQRDNWRANQVRNSWVTQGGAAGFWDAAEWEQVQRRDVATIHRWIDKQMDGTSVTVVLIGNQTYTRPHVDYEIDQSYKLGKGILGIRIHNLKNKEGFIDQPGMNPLELKKISEGTIRKSLSSIYRTYDYVNDDGYKNLGTWIEAAAKAAGR